jgi:hypothetical protein
LAGNILAKVKMLGAYEEVRKEWNKKSDESISLHHFYN